MTFRSFVPLPGRAAHFGYIHPAAWRRRGTSSNLDTCSLTAKCARCDRARRCRPSAPLPQAFIHCAPRRPILTPPSDLPRPIIAPQGFSVMCSSRDIRLTTEHATHSPLTRFRCSYSPHTETDLRTLCSTQLQSIQNARPTSQPSRCHQSPRDTSAASPPTSTAILPSAPSSLAFHHVIKRSRPTPSERPRRCPTSSSSLVLAMPRALARSRPTTSRYSMVRCFMPRQNSC
jgi:hypothetical protein